MLSASPSPGPLSRLPPSKPRPGGSASKKWGRLLPWELLPLQCLPQSSLPRIPQITASWTKDTLEMLQSASPKESLAHRFFLYSSNLGTCANHVTRRRRTPGCEPPSTGIEKGPQLPSQAQEGEAAVEQHSTTQDGSRMEQIRRIDREVRRLGWREDRGPSYGKDRLHQIRPASLVIHFPPPGFPLALCLFQSAKPPALKYIFQEQSCLLRED